MKNLTKVVALAATLIGAQAVRADFVVSSTYDGVTFAGTSFSAGYDTGNDNTQTRAELVHIGGSGTVDLTSLIIPLALRDPNVDVSNFTLMLVGNSGSNTPDVTSVLWSTTPTGLTTTAANYTYTLPSVTVNAGQDYWLVLEQNTTLGDTGSGLASSPLNGINWYFATSFDPSGSRAFQNVGGSSGVQATLADPWTVQSTSSPRAPLAFELTALQPVPEPGQMAMAGVLLLGAGVYAVRRKLAAAQTVAAK